VHPCCGNCGLPLRLLIQLNLGKLPEEAKEKLGGKGHLQAFYCESKACESACLADRPFSKAHHVRVVTPGPGRGVLAARVGTPFPPKAIVAWKRVKDLPSGQEHEELGLVVESHLAAGTVRVRCALVGLDTGPQRALQGFDEESVARARPKDKLLGWPCWVQNVEYPTCPRCSRLMEHVLQLDSKDHLPWMLGDAGTAHVTRCPEHTDVLTLAWACS
jgi:hypothetical protein